MPTEQQSWFAKELAELNASTLVLLTIHVTRPSASISSKFTIDKLSDDEGIQTPANSEKPSLAPSNTEADIDIERGDAKKEVAAHIRPVSLLNSSIPIILGRPATAAKINEIVDGTECSDSIIVAACGPEGLMQDIRQAVASMVGAGKRSVTLHCERFGW